MSGSTSLVIRILGLVVLFAASFAVGATSSPVARAAAPSVTVTPSSAAPHGSVVISGTGFDASGNGTQVLVDVSITTSAGTVALGSLPTDGSGNFGIANVQPLTLPFALDAPGPNTITATEEGNPGLSATTPLTGLPLQPQLNGGQPLSARLGDQLDVKGTGFAPNDILSVSLNGTSLSAAGGQSTTNADQNGAADILLVIPLDATTGTQTLTVAGRATGTGQKDQASIPLTLTTGSTGGLQIAPNPAAVGTNIRVSAGGFQPNEPVTFTLKYFDTGLNNFALENGPATADNTGHATALLNIPAAADGSKPGSVTGRGINSGVTVSGTLTFAVLSSLTFAPPTALAGAQVVINGAGFVPGEVLFVTTQLFKPPVGRFAVIDATGHFSSTVTLSTTLQPGATLPLSVSGSGGDNAGASFTVAKPVPPAVQVKPKSAAAGTTVAVTGQGFGPDENLSFSVNAMALTPVGAPPITDALGAFTATVTLAGGLAPGAYTLQVTGVTSKIAKGASIAITPSLNNRWYFAEGFTGQSPKLAFHETITLLNPNSQATNGTITYMFPDGSTESVPIMVAARRILVEDVNKDLGPNRIVSTMVQTDQPIVAQRTIVRTTGKRQLDTDYSPGQRAPQPNWYFAEGFSGVSFQPYLTVQNPGTDPVTITVTLYPPKGAPKVITAGIPGFGRYTLNVRGALPNKSFSITVAANAPVVAERVEYWGDGVGSAKFGAGVKPGASAPGKIWYFGFASVLGGDQSFISLLNPGTKPAHVTVAFFDGTGKGAGSRKATVAPNQRATLNLNDLAARNHSPIAAIISSDLNIVAEEAQYFGGSPNVGTHPGASIEGRQGTATRWSFAAGNTASYQENEYILNPSSKAVNVTATFYGADGQLLSASYPVKPKSVITVSANAIKGLHAGAHGSVWTTSGTPVVVVQTLRGKDGKSALADQGVSG